MRILYSHRIQSRDGQSVHMEELISAFLREGHEVRVIGPSFYDHSGFGGDSGTVALLRRLLPGALGEFAELAYNIPAYLRLRRTCREFKPDLIYERYNLYYLAGAWLARSSGLPFYLEVNSPLADERIDHGGLQLQSIARRAERYVWRTAGRILAVTGVLREIVVKTLRDAGIEHPHVDVVPNGILLVRFLPAPFEPAPTKPEPMRPVVLGFVGFVRSWHGLDAVIRAMAGHERGPAWDGRPIAFTIIGEGPARGELEQLSAELGISDRVTFSGLVDHARIPDLVAEFDIALQPKVNAYASPLKIFDYMAAGRAIVAPDQPNIREILQHDETALLFDPAATDGLWLAVARLIGDPGLRQRLGAAAREELERRDYTWSGNARRIAAMAMKDRAAGSNLLE
jgi:glycosyltransferase involved in cell wall biosynthesis